MERSRLVQCTDSLLANCCYGTVLHAKCACSTDMAVHCGCSLTKREFWGKGSKATATVETVEKATTAATAAAGPCTDAYDQQGQPPKQKRSLHLSSHAHAVMQANLEKSTVHAKD